MNKTVLLWGGPSHGKVLAIDSDMRRLNVAVLDEDVRARMFRPPVDRVKAMPWYRRAVVKVFGLEPEINRIEPVRHAEVTYVPAVFVFGARRINLMVPAEDVGKEKNFVEADARYVVEKFPEVVDHWTPRDPWEEGRYERIGR